MSLPKPLRVAIVGSGPSAFYAAEHLQKQADFDLEIDMFERLPTPFGLVRGGVAPDHPRIKSVTKVYDRIAAHPKFRFYGNVAIGTDLTLDDLVQHYHAIILATGAQTDRRLGIPGENLPTSYAATEFVGWYNGHPDYRDLVFDLSHEHAIVIGVGNVALDVARILSRTPDELQNTDIAQHALDALAQSKVKHIVVIGRRGPAQARFTSPELKELADLADANVIVSAEELELDPLSSNRLLELEDRTIGRNLELLRQYAHDTQNGRAPKSKTITLQFLRSPVEIIGEDRIEALRVVKNELYLHENGTLQARPTDEYETIPTGLIFRSIGYHGIPLPGIPFDERKGIIPNIDGCVIGDDHLPIPGEYVVGWIKRGPSGVIGTNKPDAQATVQQMLEDIADEIMLSPESPARDAIETLMYDRGIRYLTYQDWQILDQLEQERGKAVGRPRVKFTHVDDMLDAVDNFKRALVGPLG